eukprot:7297670-Prorocentrum_lima.AAC.1
MRRVGFGVRPLRDIVRDSPPAPSRVNRRKHWESKSKTLRMPCGESRRLEKAWRICCKPTGTRSTR